MQRLFRRGGQFTFPLGPDGPQMVVDVLPVPGIVVDKQYPFLEFRSHKVFEVDPELISKNFLAFPLDRQAGNKTEGTIFMEIAGG
jgi:hypothetical protein